MSTRQNAISKAFLDKMKELQEQRRKSAVRNIEITFDDSWPPIQAIVPGAIKQANLIYEHFKSQGLIGGVIPQPPITIQKNNTQTISNGKETKMEITNQGQGLLGEINNLSMIKKAEILKNCQNWFESGKKGTGKNTLASFVAKHTNRKYISTTCYRAMSQADLFGFWQIKDGNCVWFDGPVTWAFKHAPSCVALHEIDEVTNTEVEPIIMNLMDDVGIRQIFLPNGEVLSNQDVMIVGSSNFASSQLRDALRDRFEMEFPMDQYSPDQLKLIPRTANFLANISSGSTVQTEPIHSFRRHRAFEKHSKLLREQFGSEKADKIAAMLCLQIPESDIEGFLQALEISTVTGTAETEVDDLMR